MAGAVVAGQPEFIEINGLIELEPVFDGAGRAVNQENVLSSTSCAASAAACAAAEADELHYDEVFDATRRRELAAQAEMLRTLFHFPGE